MSSQYQPREGEPLPPRDQSRNRNRGQSMLLAPRARIHRWVPRLDGKMCAPFLILSLPHCMTLDHFPSLFPYLQDARLTLDPDHRHSPVALPPSRTRLNLSTCRQMHTAPSLCTPTAHTRTHTCHVTPTAPSRQRTHRSQQEAGKGKLRSQEALPSTRTSFLEL